MEIDARYERKFRVEPHEASLAEVRAALSAQPALFRPAYPDRLVHSLYLDTPDLQAFHANAAGLAERTKPRLRWYGPLDAPGGGRLEIKRRHGLVGTKELLALPTGLPPGLPGRGLSLGAWCRWASAHPWLRQFPELVPTVLVQYRRSYFTSADGRLRLTLDRDLRYAPAEAPRAGVLDAATIIELKYPVTLAAGKLPALPFRLTRNSKYVIAVLNTCQ